MAQREPKSVLQEVRGTSFVLPRAASSLRGEPARPPKAHAELPGNFSTLCAVYTSDGSGVGLRLAIARDHKEVEELKQ